MQCNESSGNVWQCLVRSTYIQRFQSPKIDLCLCTVTAKYATHGSGMTAKYEAWWSLKYSRQSASDPLMYKILWTDWWSWSKETHCLAPAFAELSGFHSQLGVLRWFFYLGCENRPAQLHFLLWKLLLSLSCKASICALLYPFYPCLCFLTLQKKLQRWKKQKNPRNQKAMALKDFGAGKIAFSVHRIIININIL